MRMLTEQELAECSSRYYESNIDPELVQRKFMEVNGLTDVRADTFAGLPDYLRLMAHSQSAPETLRRWADEVERVARGARLCAAPWEPAFDVMSPKQEELVHHFCAEIAGPRGGRGSPQDPVRLLDMAQALYEAERDECRDSRDGR